MPGADNPFDVIVLGGGAAGLFCAAVAGRRGRRVLVIEHMNDVGKKILISGGGRCNFTNLEVSAANFLSGNPDFCRSALARFSPLDFIALVEKHRIAYHEKKSGQLFCDGPARQIVQMLLEECAEAGVVVETNCAVRKVSKEERFLVTTNQGEFLSESLVLATGGLSIPKIGASDLGYAIARQFGLEIVPTAPALVPFVYNTDDRRRFGDLAGISAEALVSCQGARFRENMLFTHQGLSGPAILQISSYWQAGKLVTINLLPDVDIAQILKDDRAAGSKAEVRSILARYLPGRLAARWCELHGPKDVLARTSDARIAALAQSLQEWKFLPAETEGYRKAEVTRGGISTEELSSKTMESRKVRGLYCIGEVVDVTGWLGGYNFQWAWASAHAAGEAV